MYQATRALKDLSSFAISMPCPHQAVCGTMKLKSRPWGAPTEVEVKDHGAPRGHATKEEELKSHLQLHKPLMISRWSPQKLSTYTYEWVSTQQLHMDHFEVEFLCIGAGGVQGWAKAHIRPISIPQQVQIHGYLWSGIWTSGSLKMSESRVWTDTRWW